MTKIDLITGFLGAGKTTFIRKYAQYLLNKGENICILENDYGAINVDMMLLSDLISDKCELEMVSGGCDKDCHKRRFKTKLISMGMCGYDRVIVEPSGVFDTDEFFDALREEPLDRWYRIGSVITIVDVNTLGINHTNTNSNYILASETANAGKIVVSKLDAPLDATAIKTLVENLNTLSSSIKCDRLFSTSDILAKPFDEINEPDYESIMNSSYVHANYEKQESAEDDFESEYFMNKSLSRDELTALSKELFEDNSVIRVKGFIKEDENWLEFNATRENLTIKPVKEGQDVFIVIRHRK